MQTVQLESTAAKSPLDNPEIRSPAFKSRKCWLTRNLHSSAVAVYAVTVLLGGSLHSRKTRKEDRLGGKGRKTTQVQFNDTVTQSTKPILEGQTVSRTAPWRSGFMGDRSGGAV